MKSVDILLIIICGAGLVHGLILSVYLYVIKQKRTLSDVLLALLLFLMAIRVGKSIVLEFHNELEFLFVFLGLSVLLLIGPILYGYVRSLLDSKFSIQKRHYLEIIPFLFVLVISPIISVEWFVQNGRHWAYVLLIGIYLHFAFYICAAGVQLYRFNMIRPQEQKTKAQENILKWLRYVLIGIGFIWFSYVLNIFEDQVPYILGPIIYTVCIYGLTLIGYRLKAATFNPNSFERETKNAQIFREVVTVLERDNKFMSSDISLQTLGDLTGYSKHLISASINAYAQMNFNTFINYYRVQKAKELLSKEPYSKYTISSIAYDTGFNSLSSFNAAFKKFTKTTPSQYRSSFEY